PWTTPCRRPSAGSRGRPTSRGSTTCCRTSSRTTSGRAAPLARSSRPTTRLWTPATPATTTAPATVSTAVPPTASSPSGPPGPPPNSSRMPASSGPKGTSQTIIVGERSSVASGNARPWSSNVSQGAKSIYLDGTTHTIENPPKPYTSASTTAFHAFSAAGCQV